MCVGVITPKHDDEEARRLTVNPLGLEFICPLPYFIVRPTCIFRVSFKFTFKISSILRHNQTVHAQ